MKTRDWRDNENDPRDAVDVLLDYAERQTERAEKASRSRYPTTESPSGFPGYTTLRRIKAGGQGVVYEAVHQSTKRTVAIKVARESIRDDIAGRDRFAREVKVLSQLRHPNIVRITDSGEIAGRLYLVTDYIPGEPLDVHLEYAEHTTAEVLELFAVICDALTAAHLRGVVHRDLKPSNVLIDERGQPQILDFGLAKLIATEASLSQSPQGVTATGQFVGSLPWAAPEQIQGDPRAIDVRTDVYAIGVMLYRALTGRHPYEINGPARDVPDNIMNASPERPSSLDGGPDSETETILLKCLSKEPDRRYQSADSLARDIRRYLRGEPIAARRDSTWYVLSKMVHRHRAVTAIAGALLAAVFGWAVTASVLYERAKVAETEARQDYVRARGVLAKSVATSVALARLSGANDVRRRLLLDAQDDLAEMEAGGTDDPVIRALIAEVAVGLGDIALDSGALDEADRHLRRGTAIYETLVESDPTNLKWQTKLSIASVRVGDSAKARGDYSMARQYYEYSLAIDEELAEQYATDVHVLSNLLWSYHRMAWIEQRSGDWTKVAHFIDNQRTIAEQLTEADPDSPARLVELRALYGNQANLAGRHEDYESRLQYCRDGLAARKRLLNLEPDNPEYLQGVASGYLGVERALRVLNRTDTDERQLLRADALRIARRLIGDEPGKSLNQRLLADCQHRAACAACESGDYEAAYALHSECLSLMKTLAETEPNRPQTARAMYNALVGMARAGLHTQHREDSPAKIRQARAWAETMITRDIADADFLRYHAALLLDTTWFSSPDQDRAIEVYTMAAQKTRYADPRVVLPFCSLLRDMGRETEARNILADVLSTPRINDAPIHTRLVELYRSIRPETTTSEER